MKSDKQPDANSKISQNGCLAAMALWQGTVKAAILALLFSGIDSNDNGMRQSTGGSRHSEVQPYDGCVVATDSRQGTVIGWRW